MKNISTVIATIILISTTSCQKTVKPASEQKPMAIKDSAELIQYGKYLVTITGCNDCHTPKRMGAKGPELIPELLLSGYPASRPLPKFDLEKAKKGYAQMNEDMTAAAGPWGISFATNLTPHPTGAASWPYENFKKALMHGKYKGMDGGRMLLPPMPWFNYAGMKEEDAKAIYTYLQTLKPVENLAPHPVMAH